MQSHLILLFTTDFYSLSPHLQEDVYYEFYRLVYPMVYYIVRDHGAAEDIIQEAFMRSVKKAPQLQDTEKLESWLKTLTRNVTINYLKKFNRLRDELEPDDVFMNMEVSCTSTAVPLETEVEVKMLREAIVKYLSHLRPDYRQIVEMRWIHNMSYKEMASIMNLSEGMVRQKLFRARESIKLKLREEWGMQ